MNPYEPPLTVDVSPRKPGKRLPTILYSLIILVFVGVGFGMPYVLKRMGELKIERAVEQTIRQHQLKTNQETDEK